MSIQRRVFISATRNQDLDDRRKSIKQAIIDKLRQEGFEPLEWWESGDAVDLAWSFENVDALMRKCVGAVVIGFPRWIVSEQEIPIVGDYNQYEGAVAISHRIPVLRLAERGVSRRCIVVGGQRRAVTPIPQNAQADFVEDAAFTNGFQAWLTEVNERRDIFLGYCSQNAGTAALIQNRITGQGATVLNYKMDFRGGVSILDEIQAAAARCSAGIFLFAENDPLEGDGEGAAPRDNVVFEAGYFMSLKGPDRCLVVRQGDAKMPADLGGAIYLALQDANDVAPIETQLSNFIQNNL